MPTLWKCIELKNIRLRIRRKSNQLTESKNLVLLDVFVIGTNAREQLNSFFQQASLFANHADLLKLTNKMEMLEFNNANQTTVNNNGSFNINQHQQLLNNRPPQGQQVTGNPISPGHHVYRNHPQQQGSRFVNSAKISKHRELPVDVPDSFIGIAKQSPRYPPPKPHRQVSPSMPINNLTTFNHAPNTNLYVNNSCAQQTAVPPNNQSTAANLFNHNSSLRSSIKLRQLEKSRNGQNGNPLGQMQPAINQAFELNEDENMTNAIGQQPSHSRQAHSSSQSSSNPCSSYQRLHKNLNGEFADISNDVKLAKLLSIYQTIIQTHEKQFRLAPLTSRHNITVNSQGNPEPVTYKVSELLHSVIYMIRGEEMTKEAAILLSILSKHEMDGVCSAFDRIATLDFAKSPAPTSPQQLIPDNHIAHPPAYANNTMHHIPTHQSEDYDYATDQIQMDIENNLYQNNQNSLHPLTDIDLSGRTCTKTVPIEKASDQPLGATIKNDADGNVVIGRIVCGGAAYMSGLLHEGDELLEVNGIEMKGKNVDEVVDILKGMNGTLNFTVISRHYQDPPQRKMQENIFVKAFFKYNGEDDEFIPCKELKLSFEKGEILTILDQKDPKWWQAYREGDSECCLAGLIPSVNFLKQREKDANHEDFSDSHMKNEKKNLVSMLFTCPKGTSPRRRRKPPNVPFGPEETPYYEEVYLHYPNKYRKRPIILVGPKMIGQREIVAKLQDHDRNRFAMAISHTSKPRQEHERNGVDFHFVSREQFQADMKAGKFIECGQYQNQYYGTSFEAMREVVQSKKTCIHLLNTPSMINFRLAGAELKPYFVFVKPDHSHPEKLRNIVSAFSQPKSNVEENIRAIMAEVELIETHYLPYFDKVITVSDVDRAYQELLCEINKIESEPQWIPQFWKDSPSN